MTTMEVHDTFQIGRVANRAFAAIKRNLGAFLTISAVLTSPVLLANIFLVGDAPAPDDTAAVLANLPATFFTALLNIACLYLVQACLISGTILDSNGEKPQLGAMLSNGFRVFLPTLVISILAALGVVAGLILLIVPGVILMLMWSVAVPVRVVENTGIGESFGRSRALTKDNRMKIFGLFLLFMVVVILFGVVLGAGVGVGSVAASGTVNTEGLLFHVLEWVINVVVIALGAAGVASIYYELRTVKEGIAPQQLAAAFD
jgi:hypothetical protein